MEKGIDKCFFGWYNRQAVPMRGGETVSAAGVRAAEASCESESRSESERRAPDAKETSDNSQDRKIKK